LSYRASNEAQASAKHKATNVPFSKNADMSSLFGEISKAYKHGCYTRQCTEVGKVLLLARTPSQVDTRHE
jgi:hypothetical protein